MKVPRSFIPKLKFFCAVAATVFLLNALIFLGIVIPVTAIKQWAAMQEPMTFLWFLRPFVVLVNSGLAIFGCTKAFFFTMSYVAKAFLSPPSSP